MLTAYMAIGAGGLQGREVLTYVIESNKMADILYIAWYVSLLFWRQAGATRTPYFSIALLLNCEVYAPSNRDTELRTCRSQEYA